MTDIAAFTRAAAILVRANDDHADDIAAWDDEVGL